MDAMDKLAEDATKAGVLVESGGLLQSGAGSRVRVPGGKITVTDGPFTEAKELVGGYAILKVKSKTQAIEETLRFMQLHRQHWPGWEGEAEIRQIFSPSDFGADG
jgi:hypothetical protein